MQNRITGRFGTTQVGGMLNFRKVSDEYGISLIGEARIPKREHTICERVIELYERGELNFSFEIRYTEDHVIEKDGVLYIDAAEHNVITGMAIVSVPAYEESFALSLVAEEREVDNSDEEVNKGVENMDKAENIVTEQAVAEEEVSVSEETKPENTSEQAVAETVEAVAQTEAVAEETASEDVTAEEATTEEAVAEATTESVAEEAEDPEDHEDPKETEDTEDPEEEEKPAKAERTVAELEMALAKTEADWAVEHAQFMALEAEIADLRANKAVMDAEIERLRAVEAELAAINAAKDAEEKARNEEKARLFAEKQGLNTQDEAVASAVKSLDYKMIAELAMAQEPVKENPVVSVASFAAAEPMKIKSRFENVLKRVGE